MAGTPGRLRRIIDRSRVRREGRRWHAFYQGYRARRANRPGNPHKPGTNLHTCWEVGWDFAEEPEVQGAPGRNASRPKDLQPPVCRFGPGGDYVQDWPGPEAKP